jgi:multidrug efflux system membrane fusion protein
MSLVPGQLIDVSVALNNLKGAIVLPREAVNIGPNGRYVYAVTADGNAELRPVSILFDNGATIAVSGNIRQGDTVVTDGQLRIVPGNPVSIVRPGGRGAAHKAP